VANVYFELTREFNRDEPVALLACALAERWLPVVPADLEDDDADAQ